MPFTEVKRYEKSLKSRQTQQWPKGTNNVVILFQNTPMHMMHADFVFQYHLNNVEVLLIITGLQMNLPYKKTIHQIEYPHLFQISLAYRVHALHLFFKHNKFVLKMQGGAGALASLHTPSNISLGTVV